MEVDPNLVFAIPVITAFLQILKTIPALGKLVDWFPLFGVGLGVLVAFAVMNDVWHVELIAGLVLGTAACGAFSGLKAGALFANKLDNSG